MVRRGDEKVSTEELYDVLQVTTPKSLLAYQAMLMAVDKATFKKILDKAKERRIKW